MAIFSFFAFFLFLRRRTYFYTLFVNFRFFRKIFEKIFSSIFVNFCKFLQIFVNFCKFLQIFANFCKFLQNFTKFCKILQNFCKFWTFFGNFFPGGVKFCKFWTFFIFRENFIFIKNEDSSVKNEITDFCDFCQFCTPGEICVFGIFPGNCKIYEKHSKNEFYPKIHRCAKCVHTSKFANFGEFFEIFDVFFDVFFVKILWTRSIFH